MYPRPQLEDLIFRTTPLQRAFANPTAYKALRILKRSRLLSPLRRPHQRPIPTYARPQRTPKKP